VKFKFSPTVEAEKEVEVEKVLDELAAAKLERELVDNKIGRLQEALLKYAETTESKTLSSKRHKATVVTSERVTYNNATLKKALGAKLWNRIKREQVDSSKLKSLVSGGLIDPVIVAQHTEITQSKPYLRISGGADPTQQQDS